MSAKFVFVKRTSEEIRIFGGEVFIDIDGKNVAKLDNNTITIDVSEGTHTVKMYKSHHYGSMIGFAENVIGIRDNEILVFKYSSPMITFNSRR